MSPQTRDATKYEQGYRKLVRKIALLANRKHLLVRVIGTTVSERLTYKYLTSICKGTGLGILFERKGKTAELYAAKRDEL